MPTPWTYPTIISQYAEVEQHIPWTESKLDLIKSNDEQYLTTTKELLHISNFTASDVKMKTYYLFTSGFNFINLPEIITGIEAEVSILRGGRITDETVQLMFNNEFISDNKADFHLDPVKIYGSNNDLWGTENTAIPDVSNPLFGIGVRYQSHPSWPHRESPKLDYIRLRIW